MTTMLNKKKTMRKIDFLIFLLKANDKFLFSLQVVFFFPQSSIRTQLVCRFVRLWLHVKRSCLTFISILALYIYN